MKKIMLLFFMSTCLMAGYGQLQLQPMLTDGGMTNMQMLWRVMIQNGFTEAVEAKVKLEFGLTLELRLLEKFVPWVFAHHAG